MDVGAGNGPSRVLLVEDHQALLRVYARALTAAGFEVDTASDGMQGLGRLLSSSYNALVSDISMPVMDGMRLLESARHLRPNVPVVMITAELDSQLYGDAKDQGAVRYLLKPFHLEQLERAVRTATALGMVWERLRARR
jgi:DNA-binding response OmpR family regulator